MKINSSVEQGTIVLLMLALQKGHTPVKSHVLSHVMGVSDSYLKKTLRKLAIGGLVESSASKDGGFQLSRPVDTITLADVYQALEPEGFMFRATSTPEKIFPDGEHVSDAIEHVVQSFQEGYEAFLDRLAKRPLSDLLENGAWQDGCVDWTSR